MKQTYEQVLTKTRQVTGYELTQGPYTISQLKQFQADILAYRRDK